MVDENMSSEISLGISLAEIAFKTAKRSFRWNWGEYRIECIEEFGKKYPGSEGILSDFLSDNDNFNKLKKLSKGSEKDFQELLDGLQQVYEKTPYAFDAEKLLKDIKQAIEIKETETSFEKISLRYIQKLSDGQEKLYQKINGMDITLHKVLENTEQLLENKSDSSKPFLQNSSEHNSYIDELNSKLKEIKKPEKIFDLKYTDSEDQIHSINQLLALIKSQRLVILKGAAGSGKSGCVLSLVTQLIDQKILPVFIQINEWDVVYFKELDKIDENDYDSQMDVLLKMSKGTITVEELKSFDGNVVFIIDGINEFKAGNFGSLTEKIIKNAKEYARKTSTHTDILLTDRLDSRGSTSGWNQITLNPLDEAEIRKNLDDVIGSGKYELTDASQSLLSRPFFLNIALDTGSTSLTSESSVLENFFKNRLKLKDKEIDELTYTSYLAYYNFESVSFDSKTFTETTRPEIFEKLVNDGVITKTSNTKARFSHQLLHDFLVSKYLAEHPDEWNITSFDIATLQSGSTEVIYLTLQQIKDRGQSDKFLLEVYDWNWDVAIKSVILNKKLEIHNHTEEIVTAMLTLVAQKLFDNVYGTSDSAKKHLNDYEEPIAQQLVKASDLKVLITTVEGMDNSSALFATWASLFTIKRDSAINDETINLIKSDNSLIGWTASNIFRECILSDENQKYLRDMFDSSDADMHAQNTRRWRIVHPLGKCPSEKNKELLFTALEKDPYHWVRYGAARALVEMAAVTEDAGIRKDILDRLGNMASKLWKNIRDEIGKTVFYRNAYGAWDDSVIPLLEKIWDSKSDETHKEDWEKILIKYRKGDWKS